jgi:hypothetical protein
MQHMTFRSPARLLLGLAVTLLATAALSACGSDDGAAPAREGGEVANVVELGGRLEAAGIPCALEYEGLVDGSREVSLCQIDGGQALLTVWEDPTALDVFMDEPMTGPGATVVGPNWTIDVAEPATAERIGEALGGVVRLPDTTR